MLSFLWNCCFVIEVGGGQPRNWKKFQQGFNQDAQEHPRFSHGASSSAEFRPECFLIAVQARISIPASLV